MRRRNGENMIGYDYSFGCLKWEGETYRKDLIILPGRIICPWVREHGHRLKFGDLVGVREAAPRLLVIGTGQMGAMHVPDKVLRKLAEIGIDGRPMPTERALAHFAELLEKGKDAAAALHLTC